MPSDLGALRALSSIAGNVGTEAPNLKKLINNATNQAALDRLEALGATDIVEVERIRTRLQDGGNLSFGDLRTLSEHVPGIKKLYCTGAALYSGPDVGGKLPQLAVFSTDSDDPRQLQVRGRRTVVRAGRRTDRRSESQGRRRQGRLLGLEGKVGTGDDGGGEGGIAGKSAREGPPASGRAQRRRDVP
jgi:hypothetical protein